MDQTRGSRTMAVVVASGMTVVSGMLLVACAEHTKHTANTDEERIGRLQARLRPVVPSKAYPYAFVVGDCDPTDHPGMSIYLVEKRDDAIPPKATYIHVSLFQDDLSSLTEQTIEWPRRERPTGGAELCANGTCVVVTSGRISFGVVTGTGSVEGYLDLRFKGDVGVRTNFRAHWLRVRSLVVCG